MRGMRVAVLSLVVPTILLALLAPARAGTPPFVFPGGCCYYASSTVRTVVPPAAFPNEGRDNFYGFPSGGTADQKGVVAVAPGAAGTTGGTGSSSQ